MHTSREMKLSSYSVKGQGTNTPSDFTINFSKPIQLDNNRQYNIGLNRVINMSFTWFNINPGYNNQTTKYNSDKGSSFKDLKFAPAVWNNTRINDYIQYETKIENSDGTIEFPITLEFNDSTLKVLITLNEDYEVELRRSDFNYVIGL